MSDTTSPEGLTVKEKYQPCKSFECPRFLKLCRTREDGRPYFVEGDLAYTALVRCNNWPLGLSDGNCPINPDIDTENSQANTSPAFELATHIHDTVWQRNRMLTDEDLQDSGLRADYGIGGVEQVIATEQQQDAAMPRYETLTRKRDGSFYLQAVEGPEYTGDLSLGRHGINPQSGEEVAFRLAESLLVRNLFRVANRIVE